MLRRYMMLAAFLGALSGCATAAQRQGQTITATLAATRAQGDVCFGAINTDPSYADIARHFPLQDVTLALLTQQTDPTFATPHEVELLSSRHDRMVPCRQAWVSGFMVAPSLGTIYLETYAKSDDNLLGLAKRQLAWGEFVVRARAITDDGRIRLTAAGQRLGAELDAAHRQEMAERAAAAQAASNAMYQQQIINQNQQAIMNANRPVTTNCNRFGNTVNCTSY
jgi:hypothetical protein